MFDTVDPTIEILDPLMELRVGQFQERMHLSKFPIHVVAVFGMPAVQMHLKPLGYRLDVTAKTFDQDSGVPLGLFSGGGDLLAEGSGRGGDLIPEGGGHSFLGFAQGGDVLADALGGRRHDPFNLGKGFGIHGRPPCDGREV